MATRQREWPDNAKFARDEVYRLTHEAQQLLREAEYTTDDTRRALLETKVQVLNEQKLRLLEQIGAKR